MTINDDGVCGPILVGIDGSPSSQRAATVAAQLARALDTDVVAVHTLGVRVEGDGRRVPAAERCEAAERRLRDEWCAVPLAGCRWRPVVEFGDPADVLVRLAGALGASMVVVGSRGHRELAPELLGSTSHHVVHHCRYPVLVVPPGEIA